MRKYMSSQLEKSAIFLLSVWIYIILYHFLKKYFLYSDYSYAVNAIFVLFIFILLLIFFINKSTLGYYKFWILISFVLFTIYTYILVVYRPMIPTNGDLFNYFLDNGLLCSLFLLNIHYINVLYESHYPFFKNNINKVYSYIKTSPTIDIRLSDSYFYCILILILCVITALYANYIPSYISMFNSQQDIFFNNFYVLLIYVYLLTYLFIITFSGHVWLNLSIAYPLLLFLTRADGVNLEDNAQFEILIRVKKYFTEVVNIYSFLIIVIFSYYIFPTLNVSNNKSDINTTNNVTINAAINATPSFANSSEILQYFAYFLSIFLAINLMICLLGFFRLNSLVQFFIFNRYKELYSLSMREEISLMDLDKKHAFLKEASNVFNLKSTIILILTEAISLLILIKSTIIILDNIGII
jgi:hypothetical protein